MTPLVGEVTGISGLGAGPRLRTTLPLPPLGWVRLRATRQPNLTLTAELAGDLIAPTGYGGYGQVAREANISLTSYEGREAATLPLQLIVDRWEQQRSIEPEIDTLEQLAGYLGRPPQVAVDGRGVPHSSQREPDGRWVIDGDPAWNDVRTRASDGVRCYLDVSVVLRRLERPDPDDLEDATTRRPHQVRAGSKLTTLTTIARHYGTSWTRLRTLNAGDRKVPVDPDQRIKTGVTVRVS